MREFLTSGVGNIEYNAQKQIRESVMKRWEDLGFTEGLNGAIKENIAQLYENQAKLMLNEATASDNSGSFETVVFPIVRRIFSKLLANEIVSVQALNMPIGRLFFFKPVTSEREWDGLGDNGELNDGATGSHKGLIGYDRVNRNKKGAIEPRYYLPDDVISSITGKWVDVTTSTEYDSVDEAVEAGVDAKHLRKVGPEVVKYFEKTLYDLFYDDFLFDNSKGKVTIKVGNSTPMVLTPMGMQEFKDDLSTYKQNGVDGTIRNIILGISGFSSYNAGKLTGADGNEMDTEAFLASLKVINMTPIAAVDGETSFAANESIPFRVVTQKYGKGIVSYSSPCDAEGMMYIELDLSKPTVEQGKTLDGYIGVAPSAFNGKKTSDLFKIAWAQYDSLELETEIGEVSFQLDSVTVSVEERKLRATWSPELAQDVSAFHNIDAEAELTAILSEQIAAEIDREILRDIRKAAPWQARYDVNGWRRTAGMSTNYTQKDWYQMFMEKVNIISAQIHKSTLRGGANWLVVSSEISAMLDNLEYFHVSDASAESDQYNMGIERIGSLNGRYQVYRDPYAPYWSCIMGHKGKSLLDSGYIYAPYIPMALTPTIINPGNFAPIRGIMTRYAKKIVNNRFFGAIVVDGLMHWSTDELR